MADVERTRATAEQARAMASPVRLRILRLCYDDELTNRELADALDRDPSTVLHHTRLLVEAGLLEQVAERPGPRGSREKPYRATGLSWTLDFGEPVAEAALAGIDALREEVLAAGPDVHRSWTRVVLHLDDDDLDRLLGELQTVIDRYVEQDDERRRAGARAVGLFLLSHDQASGRAAAGPGGDPA